MSVISARMLIDRVDLHPSGTSTRDASGARVDVPGSVVADVPCRIQPTGGDEADGGARTLDITIQTSVFFDHLPADMTPGTTIKVAKYRGVEPDRKPTLTVREMVSDGLGPLALWRADCSGRA